MYIIIIESKDHVHYSLTVIIKAPNNKFKSFNSIRFTNIICS